jgi:lipopolysaccharide biosynthesis glycosyltransferase
VIACAATPGKHEAMAAWVLSEAERLTTIPVTTRIFTAADLPELALFADIPRRPTYPLEIYARLLIPFHLPHDTPHLLYLDTDTQPRADLAPLFDHYAPWNAHPTHCIAAAASLEKHGTRPQSGVLLIDVPAYRRRHTPATLSRLARTLAADPGEFPFQDEALIHRLGWTLLHPAYNARAL